jgi:LuxR family maltose regulon positive regulatory protein
MDTLARESRPIQVYALGRFDIVLEGAPLRFVSKAPSKVLALLKGLLCAGGRTLSQGTLQDALWPESDAWLARRALNTAVYRLRRLLRRKNAVVHNDGWIGLDPGLCWVDAWAFEQAIAEPQDPAALRAVLQLYGGMFLGEAEHPLAFEARARLRRKFIQGVLQVGQNYEDSGETSFATGLYESALDIDCTSEDVHRALMRCLAHEGKPSAVSAAYQQCRTVLWRHFATRPSTATELVYREACLCQSTASSAHQISLRRAKRPICSAARKASA